jgi:hypothetical protein
MPHTLLSEKLQNYNAADWPMEDKKKAIEIKNSLRHCALYSSIHNGPTVSTMTIYEIARTLEEQFLYPTNYPLPTPG